LSRKPPPAAHREGWRFAVGGPGGRSPTGSGPANGLTLSSSGGSESSPAGSVASVSSPASAGAKDSWPATVQDLSVKGVGLRLQRRFELKTVLSLQLESRNRSVSRSLEMQVVRVQKARDGKGWLVGARFVTPLTKEELQRLL